MKRLVLMVLAVTLVLTTAVFPVSTATNETEIVKPRTCLNWYGTATMWPQTVWRAALAL